MPLYIGNKCINNCSYCGFKSSNKDIKRITLEQQQVVEQVISLEKVGHKRLILVFGEHKNYDASFISETVKSVYSAKTPDGDIRRVNINAAPLDHDGFALIKDAGIGTYQIFQETYHQTTYSQVHPANTPKGDYLWRLDSLSRAFEAGCDDMGIGALFGLYDWRFEVLALVRHAEHLMETYNVGPHTISFPRLQPADGVSIDEKWRVSDEEFKRLVAILRLSVPYAGMIMTAREPEAIRRELLGFGVSQIDAGSCIELGGYGADSHQESAIHKAEQFELADARSLDEIMQELISNNYIPSFCTACYREGRTGEQFMEFAIPGFINDFCTPNALLTLMEHVMDYGSDATKSNALKLIETELEKITDPKAREQLDSELEKIKEGQRDIYY
jgi:2-iminoacetate synthase